MTDVAIPAGLQKFTIYFTREHSTYLTPMVMHVFGGVRIEPGEKYPRSMEVVPAAKLTETDARIAELIADFTRRRDNAKEAGLGIAVIVLDEILRSISGLTDA